MSEQVIIFDTTLRDGEQSPGISLDQGEKLEIAEQLARLGVDYIEAGFPVASQGDFEGVRAIAESVGQSTDVRRAPVICGLSRTALADIDRLNRTKGDLNISKAEARRIFRQDLKRFERDVCAEITTPITQGQFDALVSYAYNGGRGAVRRMAQRSNFNSGDFSRVPQEWMKLSTASGTKDPVKRARQEAVLRKRRRLELETLFSQPV